jgi:3-hydroxyacyl-[acyl-carrier-protein] dehydratase
VQLDIRKILTILPYRYPMLMIDRVVEIVHGQSIKAVKLVSYNEPQFAGHFPDDPVFPGVLVLEALQQAGALLAYATEPFDAKTSAIYFLGIDKVKFRFPVRPGSQVDLWVRVIGHDSNVWKLSGEALVEGSLCAQGEFLASVVQRA